MARYAQVENALLRIQGLPESYRIALRAKLKVFQRLGIAKDSPGKGVRLDYAFEDVCKWAVALELSQCGLAPDRIGLMGHWFWLVVKPALVPEPEGEDQFFVARPTFTTRDAVERAEASGTTGQGLFPVDPEDPYSKMIFGESALPVKHMTRAVVINLSNLRQRVVKALAETAKPKGKH